MKSQIIPIIAFIGLMAIPLLLGSIAILRLYSNRFDRADEDDQIIGDYSIDARWPASDSLSREFEQEPRWM